MVQQTMLVNSWTHILLFTLFSLSCGTVSIGASCPPLTPPQGGMLLSGCGTLPGSVCQMKCRRTGTVLKRICQESGFWSGSEFTCSGNDLDGTSDYPTCPRQLQPPYNGYFIGQCSRIVGSICTFACNPGYTLMGSTQITCLASLGRWSSLEPQCIARYTDGSTTYSGNSIATSSTSRYKCPRLAAPYGGALDGSCFQGAPVNSVCYFRCAPGWALRGSSSLVCQADGRWNGQAPTCTQQATTSGFSYPSPYGMGTWTGATGTGMTTGTATGTTWSGMTTTTGSRSRTCPSLVSPANGYLSGYCRPGYPGRSCNYYCRTGNSLIGAATLTCQSSGRWSNQPPICNRIGYLLVRTWYWK